MALYGVKQWCDNADAFGVWFGLLAGSPRCSGAAASSIAARRPRRCSTFDMAIPGSVALVIASIGTTSFDGFSQGSIWTSIAEHLITFFQNLGLGARLRSRPRSPSASS